MEVPSKLKEKFKDEKIVFDGKYFVIGDKKYNSECYRVVAENVPVVFNSCSMKVVEE